MLTAILTILARFAPRVPLALRIRIWRPPCPPGHLAIPVHRLLATGMQPPDRIWLVQWLNALAAAQALQQQYPHEEAAQLHAQRVTTLYGLLFETP